MAACWEVANTVILSAPGSGIHCGVTAADAGCWAGCCPKGFEADAPWANGFAVDGAVCPNGLTGAADWAKGLGAPNIPDPVSVAEGSCWALGRACQSFAIQQQSRGVLLQGCGQESDRGNDQGGLSKL